MLQLRLFGDFELCYQGEVVTTVNHAREQSLLAYLVLHAGVPQSRQHLAFLFWPDATESQARNNLRNLWHKLRQALPETERLLWADTQTVQWRPQIPCTVDVIDFERATTQAATRAELEAVAQLYRGDLLPSCYFEWIEPYRQRLRQQALTVLARLLDLLEDSRDYQIAITYGRHLQQLEPLDEEIYQRLMRLHAAAGDRAGALTVYRSCVATLQEELGVSPSPATEQLYLRLLNSSVDPPIRREPKREQLALVGRQAEWRKLLDGWIAAASGNPSCVVLAGEAGVGKTRLAEELLNWVSDQGYAVVKAHSYAAEGALAYAPVVTWLRSAPTNRHLSTLEPIWLSEVARLLTELLLQFPTLPVPRPMTEGWQRQHLFEALARAILTLGEPILLFLDDLQWSDRDTLEWLHYLLRRQQTQGGPRLLLLGTERSEEITSGHPLTALLEGLRRSNQVTQIEIGPLNEAETVSLAKTVFEQALTSAQAAQLYAETEGNPLFVVETMRARQGDNARLDPESQPHASQSTVSPLPQKVQVVIDTRLGQLTANAREVAGLAAAVGREFTFAILARASSQSEENLVGSLDELCQRRIVRERSAEIYDFSHDKLREVAYRTLSTARRRMLHRRIAEAIIALHGERLDPVSGQVATHYELSGLPEQAIPYYQRAAEAAQRLYANAEAIHYYSRAAALLAASPSPSPKLTITLHESLGDLLHLTGQHEKAEAAFRQALAHVQADELIQQARLLRKIGNCAVATRRFELAADTFEMAIAKLGPQQEPSDDEWWQEWFAIRLVQTMAYYWHGRPAQMRMLIEETRPFFEKYAKPKHRAGLYQALAALGMREDRYLLTEETMGYVEAWLAAQQLVDSPSELAHAIFNNGFSWLWYGDLDKAQQQLDKALRLAQQIGDIVVEARCLTYLTILYRKRGMLDQVELFVAQSLAVASIADKPEYIASAKANEAWLAWRQGNHAAALTSAQVAMDLWRELSGRLNTSLQWPALWTLVALAVEEGELPLAVEYSRRLLDPDQTRMPEPLADLLEEVIRAEERGDEQSLSVFLQKALILAQEMLYL